MHFALPLVLKCVETNKKKDTHIIDNYVECPYFQDYFYELLLQLCIINAI